jgi:hypothetical protein
MSIIRDPITDLLSARCNRCGIAINITKDAQVDYLLGLTKHNPFTGWKQDNDRCFCPRCLDTKQDR